MFKQLKATMPKEAKENMRISLPPKKRISAKRIDISKRNKQQLQSRKV